MLSDRYRLTAFDNRGAGRTALPDEPLSVPMMADDAAAVLRALDIPAAHVAGFSGGSVIAQELALRHPELVRSLVLMSTFARPDAYMRAAAGFWHWLADVAPSERAMMEAFFLWVYTPRAHADGMVEQIIEEALAFPHPQSTEAFQAQLAGFMSHDALDRLPQVAAPTLVLAGEVDILTPPRFGHEVAEAIPGARFEVMPGEAHQPFQEVAGRIQRPGRRLLARGRAIAQRSSAPGMSTQREKPEKVASRDGMPIAAWRSGEGPPLVLVHGAAADHSRWAPVLPALEERFTVLAIDRRGRGQSGDAVDYAIEREYEDLAAVVEWAGEGVNVLGHSYGGICALEAALLTNRIGRLVLYEPPMGFLESPPHVVQRLEELLEAGKRDELVALLHARGGWPSPRSGRVAALPAGVGGTARGRSHDPTRGAREQGVHLRSGPLSRA